MSIPSDSIATPRVGVIMGSQSDWPTMRHAADLLSHFGVPFETRIVSAHRTPDHLFDYAATAAARGLRVVIAGAGGAAHLPGMCASKTTLPVLGVPIESKFLRGVDSLLSIVQMPAGVPVGTLAIGEAGARNAALLAVGDPRAVGREALARTLALSPRADRRRARDDARQRLTPARAAHANLHAGVERSATPDERRRSDPGWRYALPRRAGVGATRRAHERCRSRARPLSSPGCAVVSRAHASVPSELPSMPATAAAPSSVQSIPMLVNGQWITSASTRTSDVFNPSTGQTIARVPLASAAETHAAVEAAHAAFAGWSETPVVERARLLFRYREALMKRFDELANLVTREHGKTLVEARASVQRGIEVVEFACGAPTLLMGQTLPQLARSVDGETVRHPLGVCVGITPFNFPAMVPMWMFPVALACGNTFILKPSEKVPLTSNVLAECLVEAGCPAGVFNVVHGDKESVDALLTHPLVRAISFVGSTTIAKYVYETAHRHHKRVQAAGGAKNHLIIMPDADLDQAVSALQASAFGCAGERCMAGSIALPVGNVADRFVDRLVEKSGQMSVGRTDNGERVDMGPLISAPHRDRVASYLDIGKSEGATVALDGRADVPADGFFLKPSVIDHVRPEMRVATDEIFGPVLSVIRSNTLDEALEVGRKSPFGNGASIFTQSGWAAREFKHRFNAGMIGINIGVPAPMAWFSFTGWNASFFGDLHIQGPESILFYTQGKTTMTRWFETASDAAHDPVWRQR